MNDRQYYIDLIKEQTDVRVIDAIVAGPVTDEEISAEDMDIIVEEAEIRRVQLGEDVRGIDFNEIH